MKRKNRKNTGAKLSLRGFNMFSAIVAIILLLTGVTLTQTLISTEEKTSRQIYSQLNNYSLSDTANLAMADSLQSFNYNFREKLEEYLTYDNSELQNDSGIDAFRINSKDKTFTFEEVKKDFERLILLSDNDEGKKFDAVISFVADRTIDQFQGGTYGRYNVYLDNTGPEAKEKTHNATKEAIATQGEDFLEVIDCGDNECKNGSFYFNIPLNKISQESYESLPKIIVKDLVTQEETKIAILPRTSIKIYIPLRFFKALYETRKTVRAIQEIHEKLARYKLGFCDGGAICSPRTNPLTQSTNPIWDKICPAQGFDSIVTLTGYTQTELEEIGVNSYLAGDRSGAGSAISPIGAKDICVKANEKNAFETGDANFIVHDKTLNKSTERKIDIIGCGLNSLNVVAKPEATHIITTGSQEKLTCTRIVQIYADVVYEETDPAYIVKGTYEQGKKSFYKIRISDSTFEPFDYASERNPNLPKCKPEGDTSSGHCAPTA